MSSPLSWDESPFTTDIERRADGSFILRPRRALTQYPYRSLDALRRHALAAPERILVARRGVDDEWIAISYAAMLARVQRLGAGLLRRGLSAQRPILILSGNSLEHLSLALAATYAGIPFCAVSPAYSLTASDPKRLRHVVKLLSPGLIAAFGTAEYARAIEAAIAPDVEIVGDVDAVAGRGVTRLDALESEPNESLAAAHAATGPDSVVKFVLTSGSTGEPKAVITTERMLCSNAAMLAEAMPFLEYEPPVIVDWLPWHHTFGGSHNVGLVLQYGGSLYIDDGKPTPQGFAETLRNLRDISPTVYFNVPKGFGMLAAHLAGDAQLRQSFYRRLRACFYAAASLSTHVRERLDAAALSARGERIAILSSLGATETGPAVTFTTPSTAALGVIGRPAAGNTVKLAPVDGKLEMRVRSPSVTPGYWRQPALTAAAFDEEGFYRMGDAVRWLDAQDPDQGLVFDGRLAEDFKLASGTWVSVGPLRAALVAALAPCIHDVAIAGLDRDYLAAILLPDLRECEAQLGLTSAATYRGLATHPGLLTRLWDALRAHAAAHPAGSQHVQRAMLIESAPSMADGEITDKGSINQRALLRCRADQVNLLYGSVGDARIIDIAGPPPRA